MTAPYVHTYEDLDRIDDDRDATDPTIGCTLADEGGCDGLLSPWVGWTGEEAVLCDGHRRLVLGLGAAIVSLLREFPDVPARKAG